MFQTVKENVQNGTWILNENQNFVHLFLGQNIMLIVSTTNMKPSDVSGWNGFYVITVHHGTLLFRLCTLQWTIYDEGFWIGTRKFINLYLISFFLVRNYIELLLMQSKSLSPLSWMHTITMEVTEFVKTIVGQSVKFLKHDQLFFKITHSYQTILQMCWIWKIDYNLLLHWMQRDCTHHTGRRWEAPDQVCISYENTSSVRASLAWNDCTVQYRTF